MCYNTAPKHTTAAEYNRRSVQYQRGTGSARRGDARGAWRVQLSGTAAWCAVMACSTRSPVAWGAVTAYRPKLLVVCTSPAAMNTAIHFTPSCPCPHLPPVGPPTRPQTPRSDSSLASLPISHSLTPRLRLSTPRLLPPAFPCPMHGSHLPHLPLSSDLSCQPLPLPLHPLAEPLVLGQPRFPSPPSLRPRPWARVRPRPRRSRSGPAPLRPQHPPSERQRASSFLVPTFLFLSQARHGTPTHPI